MLAAIAALFITEPARGTKESRRAGARALTGSPWRILLSIPTMWWLILSGALHNFNMYALGSFLSPLLMRYHGADLRQAGLMTMVVYGLSGIPGLLIGGALARPLGMKRRDGACSSPRSAIALSVPFMWSRCASARRTRCSSSILGSLACAFMYVYYASVYATMQDVVEPSLRGTAMALYFFAMYVLGASLGPLATGMLSDHFTRRAAARRNGARTVPRRGTALRDVLDPGAEHAPGAGALRATRTVARDMDGANDRRESKPTRGRRERVATQVPRSRSETVGGLQRTTSYSLCTSPLSNCPRTDVAQLDVVRHGAEERDPFADQHRHARDDQAVDETRAHELLDRESAVDIEVMRAGRGEFATISAGDPDMCSTPSDDRRRLLSTTTRFSPYGHSGNASTVSNVLRPITSASTLAKNSS